MANGGWRKYLLARLLKEWVGNSGWVWKLHTRYRRLHLPGDVLSIWGRVVRKIALDNIGLVEIEAGIRNQRGEETSPAWAIVALPMAEGGQVPLPFLPPAGYDASGPFKWPTPVDDPKYVTPEVRAFIGQQTEEVEAADPITSSELRRMAQAVPDMDPLYWDAEYARRTRFQGITAMPLYPVDAFRQPPHLPDRLTEQLEKDPDFQGGPPWDRRLIIDVPINTPATSNINGGQEFEIFDLARLGERLSARRKIADIFEAESRTFGRVVYRIEDVFYRNAEGREIMRSRIALLYR